MKISQRIGDTVAAVCFSIMLVIPSPPAAELFLSLQMNELRSLMEHQQREVGEDFILWNGRIKNVGRIEIFGKKLQKMSANRTRIRKIISIDSVRNGGFTRTRFSITPKTFARLSIIKEITETLLFDILDFVI